MDGLLTIVEIYERKELQVNTCIENSGQNVKCIVTSTLINSDARIDPVTEIIKEDFQIKVTPNPADEFITLSLSTQEKYTGILRVISIDGKVLHQNEIEFFGRGPSTFDRCCVLHIRYVLC